MTINKYWLMCLYMPVVGEVFKALSDPKSPGYAQIRNPKARGLDDIGLGPEFELEPAEAASEPEGVTA